MQLRDLTRNQRTILDVVKNSDHGELTRNEIREELKQQQILIHNGTLSSSINRLEAFGFLERPNGYGTPLVISYKGLSLYQDQPPKKAASPLPASAPTPKPDSLSEPTPEPKPAPLPEPTPEPDPPSLPEPTPEPTPVKQLDIATLKQELFKAMEPVKRLDMAISKQELLKAMEIEIALGQVRLRLQQPTLTAQATRVYRELLQALPGPVVEALAPISAMVDAYQ